MLRILIILVLSLSAYVKADSAREFAVPVNTAAQADVVFKAVNDWKAPKWYIGECFGDIKPRYSRLKIYETSRSSPTVEKIRLTSNKYDADRILCVR